MTTFHEIRGWHARGRELGKRFMIVVADTFAYDNYPVFTDTPNAKVAELKAMPMTGIMEVYDLSKPWPETTDIVWDMPAQDPEPGVDLGQAIALQLVEAFKQSYELDDADHQPAIEAIALALNARPESIDALVGTNIMPHSLIEDWEAEDADL